MAAVKDGDDRSDRSDRSATENNRALVSMSSKAADGKRERRFECL